MVQDIIATTDVFHPSGGGAAAMAADMGVPFLGRVPLDAALSRAAEEGRSAFATDASDAPATNSSRLANGGAATNVAANGGGTDGAVSAVKASRAGAGALPALQNIIDRVLAATERAGVVPGGGPDQSMFELGTVRA